MPDGKAADIFAYTVQEVIEAVKKIAESDSICTCKARVICTSATADSVPHHMKNGEGLIHMGNIEELNRTNIEICENFEGCTRSPNGKCNIAKKYEEWIEDKEWKAVDGTSSQGKGKEKLNKDTSYMVCAEHGRIIYFCDDGQNLRPFIEGEQLLYLSEDFIQWLIGVEGQYNYPYLCEADSDDAKKIHNVTLGIGFTFDDTGYHWDILRDYLGWTDEEIKTIIEGVYKGKNYSNSQFAITDEQAYELVMLAAEKDYIPNLNAAIRAYNAQQGQITTYSQRELEAMFDFSYNSGLPKNSSDHTYCTKINDSDQIIYYYLRKDQTGAIGAVKKFNTDTERRRINQMNLFFNQNDEDGYNCSDDLKALRDQLGF